MSRQCYALEQGSWYKEWAPDRAGDLETDLLNLPAIEPRSNSRPCHDTDGAVSSPELFYKQKDFQYATPQHYRDAVHNTVQSGSWVKTVLPKRAVL